MPVDRRDLIKHPEFIQATITRMGTNSFLLKGWTVTLSAALLALAASAPDRIFVVVALIPALSFWGLDAYYLRQERLFRELYDDLRLASNKNLAEVDPFSMSTTKYVGAVACWSRTLLSRSVLSLHGVVVGALLVAILLLGATEGMEGDHGTSSLLQFPL